MQFIIFKFSKILLLKDRAGANVMNNFNLVYLGNVK